MTPTFLLALLACAPEPPPPASIAVARALPNVVLITLDTTRADRIGAYGYGDAHTENLDALAGRGRRYARTWSPLPLTIPSHASLFTGRWPAHLGVRANGDARVSDDELMLAEVMSRAGYATVASVGAFVTTREWGFAQGFDAYFDDVPRDRDFWHGERRGEAVVDDLLGWTAARAPNDPRPLFAWVHLYDAHFPYVAGDPWLSEAGGRRYDAELAYVDDQVGRLVAAFDPERTIFVVVGDHGEGLGDHGELGHGFFVYDPTMRVPWIVAGPGIAPEVVDAPASLVDVAPTLIGLLGLDPLERVDGLAEPGPVGRPIVLESWQMRQRFGIAPHVAIVQDGYKLIDLPRPELYAVDGDERTDLAESEPERVAAMRKALADLQLPPPHADAAHPTTPGMVRQLEALGYVEGGFLGDPEEVGADPKDREEMLRLTQLGDVLAMEGQRAELEAIVTRLAREWPDVVEFQLKEARLLAERGELDAAIARLESLLERDPENAIAIQGLGALFANRGRFADAAVQFQEAAERMPWAPRLRVMAVASLFESENGTRPGFELAKGYLRDHPDDFGLCGLIGVQMVRHGQFEQGMALLERGLRADVPEVDVAYLLAAARLGRGDRTGAEDLLRLELRHYPGNARAEVALLGILGHRGAWQEQIDEARRWLAGPGRRQLSARHQPPLPPGAPPGPSAERTDPAMADLWHVQAQALFNLKRYAEAREMVTVGFDIDPDRANLLLLDANLLWQEGRQDEATARFEAAKAAKAHEDAERGPEPTLNAPEPTAPPGG